MVKKWGANLAKKLKLRLHDLDAAESMEDLPHMTGRWEQLTADLAGLWSGRLTGNWRVIVRPGDDEATVEVVDVTDYHRR